MAADLVVTAANVCQLSIPFISLTGYLPQWIRILRTRSSDAISLRAWGLWTVSAAFAVFYAVVQLLVTGRGWPLIISSTLALGSVLVTVALVMIYRSKPRPAAPAQ